MRLLLLNGAVCLACLLALGQTAGAQTPPLTLEESIRRALARGFDMEANRQDLEIARDNLPIADSAFDPVLSAGSRLGVTRSAGEDSLPDSRNDSLSTGVGVSQRLHSGASLGLDVNLNRSESDPGLALLNPAYGSDLTLALRQPLLKGFGRAITDQPIRRAEIGTEMAERDYFGRALDIVQSVENAYFLLAGTRDQVTVVQASLEHAQALYDESRALHAAGMATKVDLLQAEVGVANARQRLVDAEAAVAAGEDGLQALIGRFELGQPLGPTVIDDAVSAPAPDVEVSYELALAHQPAYRNARQAVELTRLDVQAAEDNLKPALDLDLALGLGGRDRTAPDAFAGALATDDESWQVGLTFSVPLGRVAEKARYRQSQVRLDQQQLRLRQLEQDILLRVRDAVRNVDTSRESVALAALSADLSQLQYEAEVERFEAGLSTSRRVLEVLIDLEGARVQELQSQLNLRTALAALRRIEGRSLAYYGVALPQVADSGS